MIYPVILAGGSSSRLWPVSRQSYLKQFTELFGPLYLFQQTASRVSNSSAIDFASPTVVTNNDFRFIVANQLQSIGVEPSAIIIDGTATLTLDDNKITLASGQSIYIPRQSKHRLENLDAGPLELIEVQIGSYFGEDDIVRYDDVYKRGNANRKRLLLALLDSLA